MQERVRTGEAGGCGGGAGGDLGARPVLHLDQNLGWTHPGQLTDALVPQPQLSCHMTHVRECAAGELGWGRALPGVSQKPFPPSNATFPKPLRYWSQRRPKSTLPSRRLWIRSQPGGTGDRGEDEQRRVSGSHASWEKPRLLTAVLSGLITEDPEGRSRGDGPDQVHLGGGASAAEDVLTLCPWRTDPRSHVRWTRQPAAGGAAALTRHHRDGTPGPAGLPAVLRLGLEGLLQPLDLLPHPVQDALRGEDASSRLSGRHGDIQASTHDTMIRV